MKIDENYIEKLCNTVAKTILEVFENLSIEDVNMYQLGYNKAIDDFAEKICNDAEYFTATVYGEKADILTLDYFTDLVFEVAEQLKSKTEL